MLTQQKEIYKEDDNTTTFLHQHPQEKQKYAPSSKCLQRKCSNVTTGYANIISSRAFFVMIKYPIKFHGNFVYCYIHNAHKVPCFLATYVTLA